MTGIAKKKYGGITKKNKPKRKPSAYNDFMKKSIAAIKVEFPDLNHRSAFKLATVRVRCLDRYVLSNVVTVANRARKPSGSVGRPSVSASRDFFDAHSPINTRYEHIFYASFLAKNNT